MESRAADVIPSLMTVLSEAVADAKKDAADLRPLLRDKTGKAKSEKQIKRYLDGTGLPTSGEIDRLTRVVASFTGGHDRFDFWDTALSRAREAEHGLTQIEKAEASTREAAERLRRSKPTRQRKQTG